MKTTAGVSVGCTLMDFRTLPAAQSVHDDCGVAAAVVVPFPAHEIKLIAPHADVAARIKLHQPGCCEVMDAVATHERGGDSRCSNRRYAKGGEFTVIEQEAAIPGEVSCVRS